MFTTASSPSIGTGFRRNRVLQAVTAIFALYWGVLAIAPVYRFDWFLENILVLATVVYLAATYRTRPLSDLSYILIALFLALHSYGAHYTYSETPAGDWLKDSFGFARNPYDRLVHLSFGLLLAYPVHELLARAARLKGWWGYVLALALCMAMSETYELMEWATAQVIDPEAAMAFLGTQGDIFDAQKDTALAALGALASLSLMAVIRFTRSGAGGKPKSPHPS